MAPERPRPHKDNHTCPPNRGARRGPPRTWEEYIAWTDTTARYPQHDNAALNYLTAKLVGEVGEVHEALGKSIRDGWDVETTRDRLLDELGDVLWYVAQLSHHNMVVEILVKGDWFNNEPTGGRFHRPAFEEVMAEIAKEAVETRREFIAGPGYLEGMYLVDLYRACRALGYSVAEVAAYNQCKLEDRRAKL